MEKLLLDFAEAISPALQTLLQAFAAVLAAQLVAYARKVYQVKSGELSEQQRYFFEMIVSSAVRAAEQMHDDGETKREYAFEIVQQSLKKYGISLDVSLIYSEIEAQVFSRFGEG
jgi:hypothetical protein